MKVANIKWLFAPATHTCLFLALPAFGGTIYNFDENCHGTIVTGAFTISNPCFNGVADPGPGGHSTMFYSLPNSIGNMPTGDLVLIDPDTLTASDLLRFDGTVGGVFVYSVIDANFPADTGFPTALYPLTLAGLEGSLGGGLRGISYTPSVNQVGSFAGLLSEPTFNFISGAALIGVPDTATYLLVGASLVALGRIRLRQIRT